MVSVFLLRNSGQEGRPPTVGGLIGPSVTTKMLAWRHPQELEIGSDLHSDSSVVTSRSKYGWIGGMPGN